MNILKISKNIFQLSFPQGDGNPLSNNITFIKDQNDIIIIDTAYSAEMKKALEFFNEKKYNIRHIMISHYHPDHFDGLEQFQDKKISIYADKKFQQTLDDHNWKIPDYQTPNHFYKEESNFQWGDYKLSFLPLPGHSLCCTGIEIDDAVCVIGDVIINTAAGQIALPFLGSGLHQNYLDSLTLLKSKNYSILLLGHGNYISGTKEINNVIDRVSAYISELVQFKKMNHNSEDVFSLHHSFEMSKWHENNLKTFNN